MNYATIEDLKAYWKPLSDYEAHNAEILIGDASAKIRLRAKGLGKDFDAMVAEDEDLASVAKTIVCKAVSNSMKQQDSLPFSQYTESAGGYSVSGTFVNAGGGLNFSKADWKELGLRKQTYGGLEIYGNNQGD